MIFLRERERTNHKISNENKYIKFFSKKKNNNNNNNKALIPKF